MSNMYKMPSMNAPEKTSRRNQHHFSTLKWVEKLINKKLKEQRWAIMTTLCDGAILEYNGSGDPITHIIRHEASLLENPDNDDHLELLFPKRLSGMTYSWFFGVPESFI